MVTERRLSSMVSVIVIVTLRVRFRESMGLNFIVRFFRAILHIGLSLVLELALVFNSVKQG